MNDVAQHLLDMVELRLAIVLRGIDPIVNHPELVQFRVDIDTGDHPDTLDDRFLVAAPLSSYQFDIVTMAFVEHRVIKDDVGIFTGDELVFDVVEDQLRRDVVVFEEAFDGVVAAFSGMVSEVGERVVDLAREQKLAIIESGYFLCGNNHDEKGIVGKHQDTTPSNQPA